MLHMFLVSVTCLSKNVFLSIVKHQCHQVDLVIRTYPGLLLYRLVDEPFIDQKMSKVFVLEIITSKLWMKLHVQDAFVDNKKFK